MKKIFLCFLMLLLSFYGGQAWAQSTRLYVDDFSISPDESKDMEIKFEGDVYITAAVIVVDIPEGFEFVNKGTARRPSYIEHSDIAEGLTVNQNLVNDGRQLRATLSDGDQIGTDEMSGVLAKVFIKASSTIASGVYTITLSELSASDENAANYLTPDQTVKVTVVRDGEWTVPEITSEDPVSGTQYKVYNVGSGKYLDMGKAWFSWNTTAILSDSGISFTMTADGDNWKFIRTGTQGVFTSGNNIAGDAMHVDNTAHTYGITKLPDGYYHIHDAGGDASSTCWGYGTPSEQTVAGVVAHADASSADWKCEWAFLTDASFALFDARVNLYNLLLTASEEGVNTDEAGNVYNNASATLEQLNAAYNNLSQARYQQALATASDNNPKDITQWVLTNPDFSTGNINGWETNYVSGQQANNIGYQGATYTNGNVTISQFIEAWRPGATLGDGYLRQIVSGLPEGKYVLEADGISVWQSDGSRTVTGSQIYISADGVDYYTNMSTANNKPEHFSVQFLNTGEGDVIFGLRTVSSNGNWLCADNFKVTFYGIDLSAYATQLATEVTTFEGYQNSIDATTYSSLQTQVNALSNATYTSSRTYATAIAHMQAINAYAAALVAANAIDQRAEMNATVLQNLQEAIDASVDASDAGALETATSNLNAVVANANTSIANYVEAKSILNAASIYDAIGQASYAADETIVAIQTAYDDNTLIAVTEEQKIAAQNALITACKAQIQPANGCDMTAYIINPNFDSNADGWTTDKTGNGWSAEPYNGNNHNVEYWSPSVIDDNVSTRFFDYHQTITSLPNGAYTISANMLNSTNNEENEEGHDAVNWNGGGNAGVYGKTATDEKRELITINDQTFRTYTTAEILVVGGELTIGVKNINPLTGRWFAADNFKLTYVRQLTAEETEVIAKENAKAAYDEALAAAQAFEEGTIPSTAYSNLQKVITNNTLEDGSSSDYNAAAAALNEAAAANRPLVAPYSAWKALKTQGDALVEVSTNNVEKNETLSSAISELNNTVEAATTFDEIIPATSSLRTAMIIYATTAQPTNDECFDLTFMLVNPHFKEGEGVTAIPTGWDLESGSITEHRLATHNFEAFHTPFNLSQTIPNLPKGTYKVTLQGFARHDNNGPTDKTNLYCGIVNQQIKDIKDEYSENPLTNGKPAMGDNYGESSYTLGDKTVYQPNGMSGSYYFFQEINPDTNQPFYTNEVKTYITEPGDLKIGFKCETNTDWVIWDNFHLYYYGSAIEVTIDEDASVSYSEDIDNANVTLKRTIKANTWNTFVVPFDIDNTTLKAQFGDNVKVAVFSEVANGEYSTISFDEMQEEEAAITANRPVLLWTPIAGSTYTFKGVTVKTGEPIAEGGVNYEFVGTYAALITLKDGDYFIANNKLWPAENDVTTVKGTRAYLKANSAEARIVDFRIGDSESTGIVSVDNGVKSIDNATFDLQGRKVTNVKKGLYIKNSKKVVVR